MKKIILILILACSLFADSWQRVSSGGGNSGKPCFSAYQSTTQNIPANSWTKIQFQNKEFDTTNAYSVSQSRFQPLLPGYYQVNANVSLDGNTQMINVGIYKNGNLSKSGTYAAPNALYGSGVSAIIPVDSATDYIEIYLQTNQNRNTWLNNSLTQIYFQACYIGN